MKPAGRSTVTRGDDGFVREEQDPVDSFRMSLMDHLRELRTRLIHSLIALLIACIICFAFADHIWAALVAPMNQALLETGRGTMAMTDPLEGVMTYLKVAFLAALGLASPVIFWQMWLFVAPGLYPKEQKVVLPLVLSSTALFLGGAAFGYFVIFKFAFPFFLSVTTEDVAAVLSMSSYLNMAAKLLLAFGASFQLPVVVWFLARIGLVNHQDMIRAFRYAVVAIFVVAAILTPPDVISQVLMALPLIVLYGASILIARVVSTKPVTAPETPPAS